jgi:hypothetical protein
MEAIIETPALLDRLFDVLRPQLAGQKSDFNAKSDQASARRSTAGETATTSLQASATMRSGKEAARRTRK